MSPLKGSNWDTGTWALILTDGIAGFIGCGGEAIITYRHIERYALHHYIVDINR